MKSQKGQLVIISLIFLAVILILVASLFARTAGFLRFGGNSLRTEQAITLAEAGIDNAIWQLNKTVGNCPSPYCGTEQVVGTTGSFIVTIQDKTASLKTITSTGFIPNTTSPHAKKTIKVDVLVGEGISFRYAVQTLEGGVTMSNSAIINGNIYSNGSILAGAGSGQVITGDAYAVGTIDEEPTGPIAVGGVVVEGTDSQPAPDITELVTTFKNTATDGGTTDCTPLPDQTCEIDSDGNLNPQKYIGNLKITSNAIVILKGPVWVAKDGFGNGGNFSMSQGETTLKLDEGFGSNSTGVVIDGKVDLTQGGNLQPTTANPKGYIMVISNSTANDSVKISQSGATGIFYALQGGGILSQTAHVAALVAKSLTMSQSSTLDYDTGLADARFTTGPGGSWQIKKGTYRFTSSP